VTFVRCDCWIDGWQERDDPLEAARRYLETYAPVRRDELEHWFAHRLDVWDELDLEEVDVEGYRTFVLRGQEFPDAKPTPFRKLSRAQQTELEEEAARVARTYRAEPVLLKP
jgi:hypothetical protein